MSTSTATLSQAAHTLTLAVQKRVSREGHDRMIQTGLLADLFEAADHGNLKAVDRNAFRVMLGLPQIQPRIKSRSVLRPLCVVDLPSIDHFCGLNEIDPKKFSWESEVDRLFLGKIEEPVSGSRISLHEILGPVQDKVIRAAIAVDQKEITLGQCVRFLEIHGDYSKWYLAYITDKFGTLWAVRSVWSVKKWHIEPSPIDVDYRGFRVGEVLLSLANPQDLEI